MLPQAVRELVEGLLRGRAEARRTCREEAQCGRTGLGWIGRGFLKQSAGLGLVPAFLGKERARQGDTKAVAILAGQRDDGGGEDFLGFRPTPLDRG